jgi:hypothetical protein
MDNNNLNPAKRRQYIFSYSYSKKCSDTPVRDWIWVAVKSGEESIVPYGHVIKLREFFSVSWWLRDFVAQKTATKVQKH